MQKLALLIFSSLFVSSAFAQTEIGVFGGLSNYQGDLVDKPYQSSRAAFGLRVGRAITSRITLRAGLTFGKVAGFDAQSKQPDLRARNLSFETPITELALTGEFNTFDMDVKRWSPFVFAGLAVYHDNPYTKDQAGNKVFLRPLSTEGQGLPGYEAKEYALTQLALPFGAGVKFDVSDNIRIGLEVGLRKLFTDYLDDVSTTYADPNDLLQYKGQQAVDLSYRGDELPNGNPAYPAKGETRGGAKYKDYYYFSGLHINFRLPEGDGFGGGRKKGYGCPTVF
jgi:hypothetical protein